MTYEVDYAEGEKKGCSSQLTIENRIFYVKLFESASSPPRYFAGDQNGVILKEISGNEFDLWLRILAGGKAYVAEIKAKLSSGKRY